MARMPDLVKFAEEHSMPIVSIADMIQYRFGRESLLEREIDAPFATEYGDNWRIRVYRNIVDGGEHIVLICGDVANAAEPVPVRVTHECIVGDVFRGRDCECGWQLHGAMEYMADKGCGVVVYLDGPELSRLQGGPPIRAGAGSGRREPERG